MLRNFKNLLSHNLFWQHQNYIKNVFKLTPSSLTAKSQILYVHSSCYKMCECKTIGVVASTDKYLKESKEQLPNYNFVQIVLKTEDVNVAGSKEKVFKENLALLDSFEIIFGECQEIFPYFQQLKNVKWIQNAWAGVEVVINHIDSTKPVPSFRFTRFGGFFGMHMSEYVISNIINVERNCFKFHELQQNSEWGKGGPSHKMVHYRLLNKLSILILGVGTIGLDVAHKCKFFGMKVIGMCTKFPDVKNENIDEYVVTSQLEEALRKCDYICNILPSTYETTNLLSGDVLKNCKDHKAVFINIGRGSVIDEESIINAIEKQWIGGAVLDVFNKEPLPKESKLWLLNNVHITPHISGLSFPDEVVQCFKENLKRYEEKKPLKYQVSWEKMY